MNPPAGDLLELIQQQISPHWSFEETKPARRPKGAAETESELVLCCSSGGQQISYRGRQEKPDPNSAPVWTEDYGLIVRAGHPRRTGRRIVFLMAGAHSLGTGAACLATTSTKLIKEIRSRLCGKTNQDILADKDAGIWILVKGTVRSPDFHLYEDNVKIVDVGTFG